MKLKLECLVDVNTGKHLEIEIPDEHYDTKILPLRVAAWKTGRRFRMGLTEDKPKEPSDS